MVVFNVNFYPVSSIRKIDPLTLFADQFKNTTTKPIPVKLSILLSFFFAWSLLNGQNFTEVTDAPFPGVNRSSVAFADVDNDNDQDLLITGRQASNSTARISKLYLNDGTGNFSEKTGTPFIDVINSSVAFSDVDNDNDMDLLITGSDNRDRYAELYLNDGLGNFEVADNTQLEGVLAGSAAFADVDGDNDMDLVITGDSDNDSRTAKLYINDGSGSFTEIIGTPFAGVRLSSIAFSDVDNDSDSDLIIAGISRDGFVTKLYLNNGLGVFTENVNSPFAGVQNGHVTFADIDGDNDQDLLVTGTARINSETDYIAKIYVNDGSGTFSESTTQLVGVRYSSADFSDMDGDGDLDLVISGQPYVGPYLTKLYINDGSGLFTETVNSQLENVYLGDILFEDVDGDADEDLFVTGENNLGERISKLYLNNLMTSSDPGTVDNHLISIYPNPVLSGTSVLVDLPENYKLGSLTLYDSSGRSINDLNISDNFQHHSGSGYRLDIGELPKGIYYIKYVDSNKYTIRKMIVN